MPILFLCIYHPDEDYFGDIPGWKEAVSAQEMVELFLLKQNKDAIVYPVYISADEKIIGMELIDDNVEILSVTAKGYGKRSISSQYRKQTRGGKGILAMKLTSKNGEIIAIKPANKEPTKGISNTRANGVPIAMVEPVFFRMKRMLCGMPISFLSSV